MRYLIVNADDFGASPGSNRGIVTAHRDGIVTSTSLMVDTPWSEDAAALAASVPDLSIGVHLDLDRVTAADIAGELARQTDRFERLMGAPPTHLDSHHDRHSDPELLPEALRFARARGLPLRGHSAVHTCSKFYGQWGGATHFEQIGVPGLERVLAAGTRDGVTELSCHPGYPDAALHSSYLVEREIELRTLCDPAARQVLAALELQLISFRDLARLGSARLEGVTS
jgi:chitin disaccharide deacetylase